MTSHLSKEELEALFDGLDGKKPLHVTHIRYKNAEEIRRTQVMTLAECQEFVLTSHQDGHQPGGDCEVPLDSNRILVGHHDGIYWIEDAKQQPDDRRDA